MVRVVSYNIHCGVGVDGHYDLARVAGVLRRAGADLACQQEAEVKFTERKIRHWSQSHSDNQAELIARSCGLSHYSFAGPLNAHVGPTAVARPKKGCCQITFEEVLLRDKEGKSGYGNAILSKFPILDARGLVFQQAQRPLSQECVYTHREPQPRGARAALVDLADADAGGDTGGQAGVRDQRKEDDVGPAACCANREKLSSAPTQPLWVVCTHLSHKVSPEEQRTQATQLLEWIDSLVLESQGSATPAAFLLCGDMNAPPQIPGSSYSAIARRQGWRDLWSEAGTYCCQVTFPTLLCYLPLYSACGVRLDHMFVLEHPGAARLRCSFVRTLGGDEDADGSDHVAVVAELQFVPPAEGGLLRGVSSGGNGAGGGAGGGGGSGVSRGRGPWELAA